MLIRLVYIKLFYCYLITNHIVYLFDGFLFIFEYKEKHLKHKTIKKGRTEWGKEEGKKGRREERKNWRKGEGEEKIDPC